MSLEASRRIAGEELGKNIISTNRHPPGLVPFFTTLFGLSRGRLGNLFKMKRKVITSSDLSARQARIRTGLGCRIPRFFSLVDASTSFGRGFSFECWSLFLLAVRFSFCNGLRLLTLLNRYSYVGFLRASWIC